VKSQRQSFTGVASIREPSNDLARATRPELVFGGALSGADLADLVERTPVAPPSRAYAAIAGDPPRQIPSNEEVRPHRADRVFSVRDEPGRDRLERGRSVNTKMHEAGLL
jgi:hypothetical protein